MFSVKIDMPQVIIFGAKGTLGQYLNTEFTTAGYSVLSWDREDGDIIASKTIRKICAVYPNIIINATGYNAVDKAESDEKEKALCFAINSVAPQNLAEAAKKVGAIFVNYSSDYVFRGDKEGGYTENDLPDPINVYGESKYLGEKKIQLVGGKYYIIRPSRIFGKAGTSGQSKKSFVDIMVEKKDDPEIKVVNEEKGSPTYAPDLAKLTRRLIEEEKPSGIYHGANSGACTWYEWAEEIFKILGGGGPQLISVSGSEFVRPAKRPMYSSLINTKLPPQRSWQEALKEYLKKSI